MYFAWLSPPMRFSILWKGTPISQFSILKEWETKKFQLNSVGIIIFLKIKSPGRSQFTELWYDSWVQTIYKNQILIRFEDELKCIHLPIAYKESALKYYQNRKYIQKFSQTSNPRYIFENFRIVIACPFGEWKCEDHRVLLCFASVREAKAEYSFVSRPLCAIEWLRKAWNQAR